MIREEKKSKFLEKKNLAQELKEYSITAGVSFLVASVIAMSLFNHAREEMIKNLYNGNPEQNKINRKIAQEIVMQDDFAKDLISQKYSVCMHVGNLYEAAGDYKSAESAFLLATEKTKLNNYTPYLHLVNMLIAQEKFDEAKAVLKSKKDVNDKGLIKFKARAYIVMGDKYYSIGKFLSAAKSYEKAQYYYNKFSKKDKAIEKSISERIVNSYIKASDIIIKSGFNADGIRFLKRAEKLAPNNFEIKYKLAIVYSDFDPIKSIKYFDELLDKKPQYVDYGVYGKALMKSANIADLEGRPTEAKYYRYKIHSLDIFAEQKVLYKNDVEMIMDSFTLGKVWFKYKLKAVYRVKNISNSDINRLSADFVLRDEDENILETVSKTFVRKANPLYSNGGVSDEIEVVFGKNIFTKKELEQYAIDIYLYKDKKYKTLVGTMKIPSRSVKGS